MEFRNSDQCDENSLSCIDGKSLSSGGNSQLEEVQDLISEEDSEISIRKPDGLDSNSNSLSGCKGSSENISIDISNHSTKKDSSDSMDISRSVSSCKVDEPSDDDESTNMAVEDTFKVSDVDMNDDTTPVNEDVTFMNEGAVSMNGSATSMNEDAASMNEDVASMNEDAASINEDVASMNEDAVSINDDVASMNLDVAKNKNPSVNILSAGNIDSSSNGDDNFAAAGDSGNDSEQSRLEKQANMKCPSSANDAITEDTLNKDSALHSEDTGELASESVPDKPAVQNLSKNCTENVDENSSTSVDLKESSQQVKETLGSSPDNFEDNVGMDLSIKSTLYKSAKVSPSCTDSSKTGDKEECLSEAVTAGDNKDDKHLNIDNAQDDIQELDSKEIGFPEVFRGNVTVGRYISVKGDFTLRSTEALVESPSLVSPFLLKEPDIFPSREQPLKQDKMFFRSSIGEFLVSLGLSRAKELYHRDMINMKQKQLKRSGQQAGIEQELKLYQSNHTQAKMANEPFTFPIKSCSNCNFVTESALVLEGHMLAPHITSRKEYQCSYCPHLEKDTKAILSHVRMVHNKVGHILTPQISHECPNCIFECNSKVKFSNHVARCLKYFDSSANQAPLRDFEFPCLTPKPITVAVVKAYEKSLSSMQNRYRKPKRDMDFYQRSGGIQDSLILPDGANSARKGMRHPRPLTLNTYGFPNVHPASRFSQFANATSGMIPQDLTASSPIQFPFMLQKSKPAESLKSALPPGLPQPPKLQGPYPVQMDTYLPPSNSSNTPNSLVVCEICDGYIKDMEQLRTHMQLIHKVKIHPKVLSSRPPLNCQKCQWRFFTDQGLERHLLGSHGLVTSNMQEMANKGKDAGCCTICGRVFASKLVAHMNQSHKVTLKPAHLSYKCTVCSATFNLYRLFENHVYLVHSGATKRSPESNDLPPSKKLASWDSVQAGIKEKRVRNLAEKENGAT